MKRLGIIFFLLILIIAAGIFFFLRQSPPVKSIDGSLSIVFTHNVNGETHPCGCRHFPLGGLAQVAGQLVESRKKGSVIFIDSGDSFFPSSSIPDSVSRSVQFTARQLVKAYELLGVDFFVPGDQDFAFGEEFLNEITKNSTITFLVSNLVEPSILKHSPLQIVRDQYNTYFLLGYVDPEILPQHEQKKFRSFRESIEIWRQELRKAGYRSDDSTQRLIFISHAGFDQDRRILEVFPEVDWVIGSHSQSFTTIPRTEGKTRLVQVLSRNHYLGEIHFGKEKDEFEIHEIRDELKDNLNPNPLLAFTSKYKEELTKVQAEEQKALDPFKGQVSLYSTAKSCMECHKIQGNFWQGTAHSAAYATLMKAKQEKDMGCIGCHSLGFQQNRGFQRSDHIVIKNQGPMNEDYWGQVSAIFSPLKSVRDSSPSVLRKWSKSWMALDKKFGVEHNFSNVQCLNCHDKHPDHPFSTQEVALEGQQRKESIEKKCLACHTPDQSTEWYADKVLDRKKFDISYKKVSCPVGAVE